MRGLPRRWTATSRRCYAGSSSGKAVDTLPDRLSLAKTNELSHGEFLVLSDEATRRDATSAQGLRAFTARRGVIDREQLGAGSTQLKTRLDAVNEQMADQAVTPVFADLVRAEDVKAAWELLDIDRQRAVIDALLAVELQRPGDTTPSRVSPDRRLGPPDECSSHGR